MTTPPDDGADIAGAAEPAEPTPRQHTELSGLAE
jgi:hypothetical protein